MNHIRRVLTALITFAGAPAVFAVTAPAAFAIRMPPPGGTGPTQSRVHTALVGGISGWQITLIAAAAAAALAAALLAVPLDHAWVARKVQAPAT